jgi:hypothetical protein
MLCVAQLPQTETESGGDAMKCRRFRLENGEGVGDRDEVYFNKPKMNFNFLSLISD